MILGQSTYNKLIDTRRTSNLVWPSTIANLGIRSTQLIKKCSQGIECNK